MTTVNDIPVNRDSAATRCYIQDMGVEKRRGDTPRAPQEIAALSLDRILPTVQRPARYTDREWNAVRKEWDSARVHLVLAYPDVYEVGMSNLGLAILYELLNAQPELLVDRVYAPWVDMEAAMRAHGIPLYGLESRRPLRDFDVIGFTLPYELNYTNILNMLDLAGLPLRAEERGADLPLVIGGGSGAYNPEPVSEFFDLFAVGDGEEVALELMQAIAAWIEAGRQDKAAFLRQAAQIPGIYVPSLYRVDYHPDGTVAAVTPTVPEAPPVVQRRFVLSLPPVPCRPVVPYVETVHDRGVVEIQRGCTQGCRFCQAGFIYRPLRQRPLEEVLEMVEAIERSTGYEEIALLSLSSCDHPQIEDMVRALVERYKEPPLAISLPSLRIDSFSVELGELMQGRRKTGLTFAPEAGSQRLRDVINKKVTEEDMLRTAQAAYSRGWQRIKLYFMIGLPTETDDDVAAIVHLVRRVWEIGRKYHGRRARVSVSVATFVPKPHTPFQWLSLADEDVLRRRQAILQRGLRKRGINLSWHDPYVTLLEAVFSRGDRRLGAVVRRAWELGARFDAWQEVFSWQRWEQAFADVGLTPDFYARRQRSFDEILPWDHISTGVSKEFLWAEYQRALGVQTTPDCRERCLGCGMVKICRSIRTAQQIPGSTGDAPCSFSLPQHSADSVKLLRYPIRSKSKEAS